jgi:hypothetical protein
MLLVDGKGGKTGMTVEFSDEVGAPVAGVVLRRGGKEEGAQAQVYPEKKVARGVLRAPRTVEWVTTAVVVEASAIGRFLAASSCTDGEKVVRGGDRLQRKTRRHDGAGKAVARQPYRWRSGARQGGEALGHARSGGTPTVRWQRGGRRCNCEQLL